MAEFKELDDKTKERIGTKLFGDGYSLATYLHQAYHQLKDIGREPALIGDAKSEKKGKLFRVFKRLEDTRNNTRKSFLETLCHEERELLLTFSHNEPPYHGYFKKCQPVRVDPVYSNDSLTRLEPKEFLLRRDLSGWDGWIYGAFAYIQRICDGWLSSTESKQIENFPDWKIIDHMSWLDFVPAVIPKEFVSGPLDQHPSYYKKLGYDLHWNAAYSCAHDRIADFLRIDWDKLLDVEGITDLTCKLARKRGK